MKKIIAVTTKEEIKFTSEDLPLLVHGKEHSGASLLSITIAAILHEQGSKLCIFTAYHMAKDEFLEQVSNVGAVFYLESEDDFEKASDFQTIIVQSGNMNLFMKVISNLTLMKSRIVFVKNIETVQTRVFDLVTKYPFIISGDVDLNMIQKDLAIFKYKTKIQFTPILGEIIPPLGSNIPRLEKYQAFCEKGEEKIVITMA